MTFIPNQSDQLSKKLLEIAESNSDLYTEEKDALRQAAEYITNLQNHIQNLKHHIEKTEKQSEGRLKILLQVRKEERAQWARAENLEAKVYQLSKNKPEK